MSYNPRVAIQSITNLRDRLPESDRSGSYTEIANVRTNKILAEATAIDQLIESNNPMVSRMARDVEVLRLRSNLREFVEGAQAELDGLFTREMDAIVNASTQASGLIPDSNAQEYRSVYRALSAEGQAKFLQDALASGNLSAAAAITEAPHALAGSKNQSIVDSYREQALAKTSSPGKVKALNQAKEITAGILGVASNIGAGARSE
jgi:hypothetical protein